VLREIDFLLKIYDRSLAYLTTRNKYYNVDGKPGNGHRVILQIPYIFNHSFLYCGYRVSSNEHFSGGVLRDTWKRKRVKPEFTY